MESAPRRARTGHDRLPARRQDGALSPRARGRNAAGTGRGARDRPGRRRRPLRRRRERGDRRRVPAHPARSPAAPAGDRADLERPARVAALISPRPPDRRLLLVDADAFYVAVARLVDPEGAGKARLLIVGGSPERRGVVTSASYDARAYGVHSAMPMARAVPRCPGAAAPSDGVCIVAPGAEAEFLLQFALADLPGVGPKAQARLARLGWRTVRDVAPLERSALVARLGEREGTWLYDRVRGVDRSSVEPEREAKSLSRDETFAADVDDDAALGAKLCVLADRASADLRDLGLAARTVTVKLRDAYFTTRQASRTLPEAVRSDRAVSAVARQLLRRLRATRRMPARLLGVALSHLVRGGPDAQLPLLDVPPESSVETERDRAIARAIDAARQHFGPDALRRGNP